MSDTTGICYTQSGSVKKYEQGLFSAQLNVFSTEYCYRRDSADSSTLVFGKVNNGSAEVDTFSTYLPYNGISIVHNIQPNGEDYYTYSGTYTKPENWSPPAGVDGPFNNSTDLKYPYYHYIVRWAGDIATWYNNKRNVLDIGKDDNPSIGVFYGKKKSINQSKVYVSLSVSEDIVLNNVVYHPYNSIEQTIHTIDMSISGDDYIDIIIGLSSKYRGGSFQLVFKDGNGNIIQAKKYQDIQLVVDRDLSFPVDNTNSRCIISKYSNKLEEVGNIYANMDGLVYYFGSTGWSNNTLYTPNKWNIIDGAPGPSNMKIDHYQSSFKITLDGHTRTIWLTTKIQSIRHFG